MWQNYYLKFPDEAGYLTYMPEALKGVGLNHAEDVVGPLNGTGFHVNLRLREQILSPEQMVFALPEPEFPQRVWA